MHPYAAVLAGNDLQHAVHVRYALHLLAELAAVPVVDSALLAEHVVGVHAPETHLRIFRWQVAGIYTRNTPRDTMEACYTTHETDERGCRITKPHCTRLEGNTTTRETTSVTKCE